jgi:hypothetical protein
MALEYIATGEIWRGEPIGDVRHPANIEQLWAAGDLAAIGLRKRVEAPPVISLDDAKAAKIAEAWSIKDARFAEATITVAVNGQLRPYGCDPVTRENIVAIVGLITAAPASVPNPRLFTPKGQLAPVNTSHAEFIAIYAEGLAMGDAFFAAYAAHKAAISALATVAEVAAYDLSAGWPA